MTMLEIEIERNAEGHQLAYLNIPNEGGMRISGPKAWGGSTNIARSGRAVLVP